MGSFYMHKNRLKSKLNTAILYVIYFYLGMKGL